MEQNKKERLEEEKKKKRLEQREREKIEILAKADEIKNQTFAFDNAGELSLKKEIEDLSIEPIDNPIERYETYYKIVNSMLRKHLPKGPQNKLARDLIYEEKNTFLTRGHRKNANGIRGADGRMSYIADIRDLINIIVEWVASRGTMFELYSKLRTVNIEKGYGDPLNK
ncbi:MAG TPA: hypothetical protein DHW31_05300 [Bacteroides graminisolvens]|uniref:Uncharacterized protein n=1 Tax=Bacteroides graminisolvens TaxID=477666 RepID=A0A3D2SH13_9BACE|nr:hypothetical protein [Bacteroides graminisolvens]